MALSQGTKKKVCYYYDGKYSAFLVYLALAKVTVKRGLEYFFPMLHAIILNDKAS